MDNLLEQVEHASVRWGMPEFASEELPYLELILLWCTSLWIKLSQELNGSFYVINNNRSGNALTSLTNESISNNQTNYTSAAWEYFV